jgi:O-antigen biosynthesis protein
MATRDNEAFLRRTISGILEKTRFARLDLIIVDNGSTDPRALTLLQSAAKDERVTLLRAPGPFNFAALNNLGAAEARGAVIVFLNNDMEIIEPEWLRELAQRATDPHVGAVGCKLLYPDGRIQHAGVVVGFGEGVGHFDAGRRDGEQGWLGRNQILHEASAVTGACLAVERAKFVAVGGFDAVHLPVEFNDIDLCLRLEELGFTTLWTPFARIVHFESASRGKATFRRLDTHAAERAYFRQRWADRLRDDPYFHPGLSLVSLSAALA